MPSLLRFAVPALLCAAPLFSQVAGVPRTGHIDSYLLNEMKKAHIPGLALAILEDGKVVYAKGYGMANLEHQVPVTPETVFQSGSTGKQYTAMAVLMLMEDGKLNLEDSIRKHFPDAPETWQPITVRHLMTHTSGMGDYTEEIDLRKDHSEEELRKLVYRQKLGFPPGEKFAYSNLGYATLGFLISKLSGQFYGDFLQARIFKPLGMSTARIISEADLIPHRAAGYVWGKGGWKNQAWVSPTFNSTADGSLYLTLGDVAKWDAALYSGQLLKPGTLAQAWTPGKLNNGKENPYNAGWMLREMNGRRLIEHGGAWQGFMAMISRYVEDRLTVVLFANLQGAPVERLTHAVAGFWNPTLTPPIPKAMEDKEPGVTALVKTRLLELAAGTAQAAHYAPAFAKELFPEGANQLKGLLGSLGTLTSMELLSRKEEGGMRISSYRLLWGETTLRCQFTLGKGDVIVGFGIRPE